VQESEYTRHIRVTMPLKVKVDGRSGMGMIYQV
jgi:hypothetical protein